MEVGGAVGLRSHSPHHWGVPIRLGMGEPCGRRRAACVLSALPAIMLG